MRFVPLSLAMTMSKEPACGIESLALRGSTAFLFFWTLHDRRAAHLRLRAHRDTTHGMHVSVSRW